MYTDDYDEMLPYSTWVNDPSYQENGVYMPNITTGMAWRIYPYVKNEKLFICPSSGTKSLSIGTWGRFYNADYPSNANVAPPTGGPYGDRAAISLGQIEKPAMKIYATNWKSGWTPTEENEYYMYAIWRVENAGQDPKFTQVHNGGTNAVFCDGHAKWFKTSYLCAAGNWSLTNDWLP